MSFDFRIRNFCDHKVFKEKLELQSDLLSLVIPRKISNTSLLRVFVDGKEVERLDPVFGFDVVLQEHFKETKTTGSQLFRLLKNKKIVLNTLDVDISTLKFYENLDRTKEIPSNAFKISTSIDSTTIEVNDNLEEDQLGKFCFITFSYSIFNKELTETALHEIQFLKFLPNQNSHVFEVSYITTVKECRKCNGFGYHNDLELDSTGNFKTVVNNEKLIQDSHIFTFTEKGSDPFYLYLGTTILSIVGSPYIRNFTELELVRTTRDSLENLQDLQESQSTVQDVPKQEKLLEIKEIKLTRRASDDTFFDLGVKISSELDEELELDTLLKFSRVV